MVDTLSDIPLRQVRKYGAFRNNHPKHGVYVFNPSFLIAAHGIAEKDAGSAQTIRTGLEVIRFPEFHPPVSENGREEKGEFISAPKCLLEGVKNRLYRPGRASLEEVRPEKFRFREVESKDAFAGAFCRLYSIHLDVFQLIAMLFLKISIGSADKYGAIRDLCFVTASGFKLDFAL